RHESPSCRDASHAARSLQSKACAIPYDAAMIRITPSLWFDERELEETFVRASGPGGQHVNKTSSAVQLRFDARRSRSLPPDVVERLIELAGNRATQDGVVVLTA